MAAATGFWNHSAAAQTALNGARPTASSAASTSGDSAGITSNDFLTLLVTEMKNQDPTANNDPNQYINQLVQVNSLEQLININQTLTTSVNGTRTTSGAIAASSPAIASAGSAGSNRAETTQPGAAALNQTAAEKSAAAVNIISPKTVSGNLSIPVAKPAAHRVAQALSDRPQIG